LTHDADSVEFLERVAPDRVVLVADAGLGSLNAIRLSLACLRSLPVEVLLNRFDPSDKLHQLNLTWLREHYAIQPHTAITELLDAIVAHRAPFS
jgi:dethiobiotin synthetase